MKCGRMRKPPYKNLRRNFPLLFVVFWFFTAGVYPFPHFVVIGKSLDPAIMDPIMIATRVMAIPFIFLFIAWKSDLLRNDDRVHSSETCSQTTVAAL